MILSKWLLTMAGLYVPHHLPADPPPIDLGRVRAAARQQSAVSTTVIKDALDRMEIEHADRRPGQIAETVEKNRSVLIATLDRLK